VTGRSVVLVDDGLESGSAMRTAVRALRRLEPREIIGAVPVASLGACKEMENEADDVLCLITPQPLGSIDVWYRDFPQTTDDEVRRLLVSSWSANHGNTTH
jgi:putative phosphoribosyl transferase